MSLGSSICFPVLTFVVISVAEANKEGFVPSFSVYIPSFMNDLWSGVLSLDMLGFREKEMERWCFLFLAVCSVLVLSNGGMAMAYRSSEDGSEEWGYAEVRPSKWKMLLWLNIIAIHFSMFNQTWSYSIFSFFFPFGWIVWHRSTHVLVAL